jgi:hypothetical protein
MLSAMWSRYGFRNIAAHAYLDIDLERVREFVTDHLPPRGPGWRTSSPGDPR